MQVSHLHKRTKFGVFPILNEDIICYKTSMGQDPQIFWSRLAPKLLVDMKKFGGAKM